MRFASRKSAPSLFDQPYLEVEWSLPYNNAIYYLKDHLGSVRAAVDGNGQLVSYDDYGPWGMQLAGRSWSAEPDLPNKFTGKERDDDFGLNWDYFGARYYDPQIGIFRTVDPLTGKMPAWSPYHYTFDNPINLVDPTGLSPEEQETSNFLSMVSFMVKAAIYHPKNKKLQTRREWAQAKL